MGVQPRSWEEGVAALGIHSMQGWGSTWAAAAVAVRPVGWTSEVEELSVPGTIQKAVVGAVEVVLPHLLQSQGLHS